MLHAEQHTKNLPSQMKQKSETVVVPTLERVPLFHFRQKGLFHVKPLDHETVVPFPKWGRQVFYCYMRGVSFSQLIQIKRYGKCFISITVLDKSVISYCFTLPHPLRQLK